MTLSPNLLSAINLVAPKVGDRFRAVPFAAACGIARSEAKAIVAAVREVVNNGFAIRTGPGRYQRAQPIEVVNLSNQPPASSGSQEDAVSKSKSTKPVSKPAKKETKPAKKETKPAKASDSKPWYDDEEVETVVNAPKVEKKAKGKTSTAKVEKPAKAKEPGEGRDSVNERKLTTGDISDVRVGSNHYVIASAFKGGKTISAAVADLELEWKPSRSAAYSKNPRNFILGYISTGIKKGFLKNA